MYCMLYVSYQVRLIQMRHLSSQVRLRYFINVCESSKHKNGTKCEKFRFPDVHIALIADY